MDGNGLCASTAEKESSVIKAWTGAGRCPGPGKCATQKMSFSASCFSLAVQVSAGSQTILPKSSGKRMYG